MRTSIHRIRGSAQSGFALVYAVGMTVVAAMLCSALLTFSIASHKTSTTKAHSLRARYLAEGALEIVKKNLQQDIANWLDPAREHKLKVDGEDVVVVTEPVGSERVVTDASGIQTTMRLFEMRATTAFRGYVGQAHRMLEVQATPTFQFAIFYASDLEVLPGANMTIGGRVHANGDVYLGSGATLSLNTNYFRAVGDIHRHRKNDPSRSEGTVRVRRYVDNPFDSSRPTEWFTLSSRSQHSGSGITSPSGYDSQFRGYDANSNGSYLDSGDLLPWGPGALHYTREAGTGEYGRGYTLQDAAHGVSQAVPPGFGSISMFEPLPSGTGGDWRFNSTSGRFQRVSAGTGDHKRGHYHERADLKILRNDDGTWAAYDGEDNDITTAVYAAISSTEIYDARQAEGSTTRVPVLSIDLARLATTGYYPANGILYTARYGQSTGTEAGGFQLVNGNELAGPLSVVSEASLYVKGDYNTVSKKPAALISDAVNLLSNAWDNGKTRGSAIPVATPTTYNAAMVTGNYLTNGSDYNGGLENLPRFHENWRDVRCTIRGSFVNLWQSRFATGRWSSATYSAPIRDWAYDPDLNNIANLPPGTPLAVTARDVVSW
ncbi:MAG: hypothetical protein JNM84_09365 [Planctomycetes bacterium]|nr:hypothetical protein [Planctomycetota bacterium]